MGQTEQRQFRNNSMIFTMLTMIGSAVNYLCQIVLGHTQPVEIFARLNAVFSFTLVLAVPGTTLSMLIARKISYNKDDLSLHFLRLVKVLLLCIFAVAPVTWLFRGVLEGYLHIHSSVGLLIVMLYVVVGYAPVAFTGLLTGLDFFVVAGLLSLFVPLFKLMGVILSVNLTAQGDRVLLVVFSAMLLGTMVASIYCPIFLKKRQIALLQPNWTKTKLNVRPDHINILACNGLLIFMCNVDLLLLNLLYPLEVVGMYSAVMLFGKIVYYMVTSIVIVMLPSVARLRKHSEKQSAILRDACLYIVALCAACFVPLYFLADRLIPLLFSSEYLPAKAYIVPTCLIALGLSLITVFFNYLVARQHERKFILIMVCGIVLLTILTLFFHTSPMGTLWSVLFTLIVCMVWSGALCFNKKLI